MANEADQAAWAQLNELKQLTLMTGGLHSAQVAHLYAWADLALPHTKKHGLGWDPEKRIVEISGNKPIKKQPKNFMNLLNGLDRSVKDLLGQDVELRVRVSGKIVYTSVGQEAKARAHSPRN